MAPAPADMYEVCTDAWSHLKSASGGRTARVSWQGPVRSAGLSRMQAPRCIGARTDTAAAAGDSSQAPPGGRTSAAGGRGARCPRQSRRWPQTQGQGCAAQGQGCAALAPPRPAWSAPAATGISRPPGLQTCAQIGLKYKFTTCHISVRALMLYVISGLCVGIRIVQ